MRVCGCLRGGDSAGNRHAAARASERARLGPAVVRRDAARVQADALEVFDCCRREHAPAMHVVHVQDRAGRAWHVVRVAALAVAIDAA
eukprot:2545501-Pleurochrysis_carterae.AAC.1